MFAANAFGGFGLGQSTLVCMGSQSQIFVSTFGSLAGVSGLGLFNGTMGGNIFAGVGIGGPLGYGPFVSLAGVSSIAVSASASLGTAGDNAVYPALYGVPGYGVTAFAISPWNGVGASFVTKASLSVSVVEAGLRAMSRFEATTSLSVSTQAALAIGALLRGTAAVQVFT